MHQLTGSLLRKRRRKAAKEEKDVQRNVQNPSTEPCLGLQDTRTTWDGDRGTKEAKNPKCEVPELCAASQRRRTLLDSSSLDSRVGLTTCFISLWIFRCPFYFRASRLCSSAPPAPARPCRTNRPSGRCAPRPAGAVSAPVPLTGVAFRRQVVPHVATQRPRRRAASGRAEARPRRFRAG